MEDHDRGLTFDLPRLLTRRRALTLLGVAVAATVVGCSGDDDSASAGTSSTSSSTSAPGAGSTTTAAGAASCDAAIPEETAGPFPGDGSNGPDALTESGVVRRDITSSFGSSTTKAEGVPLTVNLLIQDTASGCTPKVGVAVYVWHCDREGRYSMYSQGVTDENYLRGVQKSDSSGRVSFTSIVPACYAGRWPHIHFEVYSSIDDATSGGQPIATSQLAVPEATCKTVFAVAGYEQSVRNLSQVSLARDMVFGDDGGVHQLASVSGSVDAGYVFELTVPI
jgi:protocatechuate 3,4-dioxygenase beta subunit